MPKPRSRTHRQRAHQKKAHKRRAAHILAVKRDMRKKGMKDELY